mmetsp:Transcript_6747/g.15582  ORF Transcript_6747/g.15582 Transcript_6747/m.15582 type:complete len:85 (+) Transcript_6747:713-967(+)
MRGGKGHREIRASKAARERRETPEALGLQASTRTRTACSDKPRDSDDAGENPDLAYVGGRPKECFGCNFPHYNISSFDVSATQI